MMLSSAGAYGYASRCGDLGISTYLVKPVRQSELLNGIGSVLGVPSAIGERQPTDNPSEVKSASRPLRILLAEDNLVNQQFVVRLLEKRGHSVIVASDGLRAIAELEKGRFDIILMDVQMPGMDGLKATAAIRSKEKETGAHIPIVAMTAHAMKGDRERCLAAGMDSYLSKPIQLKELLAVIEELLSTTKTSGSARTKAGPVDIETIIAELDGDRELAVELAGIFLGECPRMMDAIRQALEAEDGNCIAGAAHGLKGSVGNFGAKRVFEIIGKLEQVARDGDFASAREVFSALSTEIDRLCAELRALSLEEAA